ncbi:MAG: hypothetical protein PHC61_08445, partial [Chitinivibrionales bacterium]|nr:hypothetical protein [Chitinivibrionales bacterium]
KDSTGTPVPVDSVLKGISSFTSVTTKNGLTVATFVMSNKQDLRADELLNIKVDTTAAGLKSPLQIIDNSPQINRPVYLNQKVAVSIIAPPVTPLKAAPVPFKATSNNPHNTNLLLGGDTYNKYYRQYRQWVWSEGTGTVLTFTYIVSSVPNDSLQVKLFIYDVVGNLVNSSQRPFEPVPKEFTPANSQQGSAHDFDVYWNGTNAKGMKVAPGVYRVFMYVKTTSGKNQKLMATVGVK